MVSRRELLGGAALLLAQKKISPVELTTECLARIEKLNPRLNAFITVTAGRALSRAREIQKELDAGRRRGPLHGVPVAVKDLFDTAGVRTTAGSRLWADRVPTRDADVIRKLNNAGAVIVGKTNMDEFAYGFTSATSASGPCRNPWDTSRSPGGSSGGSAVAVATGMCLAALGSDTGGSIRLPAALCGITGLKPAYGRVSTRGAAPLAWSLDHVGPMCRNAADSRRMLAAIAETPVPADARPLKTLRIGVPRAVYWDGLDPQVERAVTDALKVLGALTAGVRDVALPALPPYPEWPEMPLSYGRIISAEAYAFHRDDVKKQPDRYHAATRAIIEGGAAVTAADYIHARREMDRLRAESGRLFEDADLLVTPAAPAPAFELGKPAGLIFLRNFAPWNLYGLPAISIPCGLSKDGLPIGMQIVGPNEAVVLGAAEAYERAAGQVTPALPVSPL